MGRTELTERVGYTLEEAERAMRDDDLWSVPPAQRLELPDEEAEKEWHEAYHVLDSLVLIAHHLNQATLLALMDVQARAEIALKRAKARVREASTEYPTLPPGRGPSGLRPLSCHGSCRGPLKFRGGFADNPNGARIPRKSR